MAVSWFTRSSVLMDFFKPIKCSKQPPARAYKYIDIYPTPIFIKLTYSSGSTSMPTSWSEHILHQLPTRLARPQPARPQHGNVSVSSGFSIEWELFLPWNNQILAIGGMDEMTSNDVRITSSILDVQQLASEGNNIFHHINLIARASTKHNCFQNVVVVYGRLRDDGRLPSDFHLPFFLNSLGSLG